MLEVLYLVAIRLSHFVYIFPDHSKVNPNHMVVNLGDTVTFQCHSYGPVKWLALDEETNTFKPLPHNVKVYDNALIILKIQLITPRVYECRGHVNEFYLNSFERVTFAARCRLSVSKFYKI